MEECFSCCGRSCRFEIYDMATFHEIIISVCSDVRNCFELLTELLFTNIYCVSGENI